MLANVGLLYVGAVLFINSLMLLNRIHGKSAAIFNLFVGSLQVFTPLYLIITSKGDASIILSASGIFLFGFTYLYVGITNLLDLETNGLGWYCLWVAIVALGYSLINFTEIGDIKFGIIWLMWAYLWFLFYLLLARKLDIAVYVGKVTLIQAWITATIPAILLLTNSWDVVSSKVAVVIAALSALYFIVAFTRRGVSNKREKRVVET